MVSSRIPKIEFIILAERLTWTYMKTPKNQNKPWSDKNIAQLATLADKKKPTGLIAWELGRSKDAVYKKASEENISLHPTNKSPYNRRKQ